MHGLTLTLAISLAAGVAAPESGPPPVRHATCLRFFSLEGDVKPEALNGAVRAFSVGGLEARIALGPVKVSSRPKERFLALEVSSAITPKTIEAALKKVSPRTEELLWAAFRGPDRTLPTIVGYGALECIVGMDDDLRFFELDRGTARFFYAPGRLDAEKLRSKFKKLYEPFQAGELGELAREEIAWKLAGPVDRAAAQAAQKAIARIPGVKKATVDAASAKLAVEIEDAGLRVAAVGTGGGSAPSDALPPTSFLPDEILDALDAAKIKVEAPNPR